MYRDGNTSITMLGELCDTLPKDWHHLVRWNDEARWRYL